MQGKVYIEDFRKLVKKENLEVKTVEELFREIKSQEFLDNENFESLDEIQKSEFNDFQEELQSYQKVEVLHNDLTKSIVFVRLPQVEWEDIEERGEFNEVIKARAGVYKDTPYNRKKGLVGQKYGAEKKGETKSPQIEKLLDILSVVNSKYNDINKVTVQATPKGNWSVYYDGIETGTVIGGNQLSEKTIRDNGLEHHAEEDEPEKKIAEKSNLIKKAKEAISDAGQALASNFDADNISNLRMRAKKLGMESGMSIRGIDEAIHNAKKEWESKKGSEGKEAIYQGSISKYRNQIFKVKKESDGTNTLIIGGEDGRKIVNVPDSDLRFVSSNKVK